MIAGQGFSFVTSLAFRHCSRARYRFFREIHDGMGGHLLSAMALSQRESQNSALLTAIRSAHDDMRLLVEGGSISDANLGEAPSMEGSSILSI